MNAAIEKATGAMISRSDAIESILAKPKIDAIWNDEYFWSRKWPAMVDRYGEEVEKYVATRLKHLSP